MLLLVSLTEEHTVYLALELDRRWTEMTGVNPLDGTNYLDTVSAFIEGLKCPPLPQTPSPARRCKNRTSWGKDS